MKERKDLSYKHYCNFITGDGLGVCRSSLTQIEAPIWTSQSVGQAKIECSVNIVNKNVYIKDRTIHFEESCGPLDLYYRYNSNAADPSTAWGLSIKKLKNIGQNPMVLVEEDGHETEYKNSAGNLFKPEAFSNGTPNLYKDNSLDCWVLYHPDKEIFEHFDNDGLLIRRLDRQKHLITFKYVNKELTQINSSAGEIYEIRKEKNPEGLDNVSIYKTIERDSSKYSTLLHKYTFDQFKRLKTSSTPNNYGANYEYQDEKTAVVKKVTQSDQSELQFSYTGGVNLPWKFKEITLNDTESKNNYYRYTLNDPTPGEPNVYIVNDCFVRNHKFTVDSKNRLIKYVRPHDYQRDPSDLDTFVIGYCDAGQLKNFMYPNGKTDDYEYNDKDYCGLRTYQKKSDGQEIKWFYVVSNRPYLISKGIKINNEFAYTHYVNENDQNDPRMTRLAFEISPEGRVKQYLYDGTFLYKTKEYKNVAFNDPINPAEEYSYKDLLNWALKSTNRFNLTKLDHNIRGQIIQIRKFIDEKNDDKPDEKNMSQQINGWDIFGNLEDKTTKQDNDKKQIEKSEFDDFNRTTSFVNADKKATTTQYADTIRQITETYPNGRVEVTTCNSLNNPVSIKITSKNDDKNETRIINYNIPRTPKCIIAQETDENKSYDIKTYLFYNLEGELDFIVSQTGQVTQYSRNHKKDYQETIRYAQLLDMKEFLSKFEQPSVDFLNIMLRKIKDDPKNHHSYELYDPKGRTQYTIDEEGYVIENLFDDAKRDAGKVTYDFKFEKQEDINNFLQNRTEFKIDTTKDRFTQKFYDKDGYVIGEVDVAGYLTEYVWDSATFVTEKIIYFTPVTDRNRKTTFAEMKAKSGDVKSHTYYFGNGKNEIELEVDQNGYVTTYEYYNNSLKKSSRRYATKSNFDPKTKQRPDLPLESKEDETASYEYDILDRKVTVKYSNGKVENYQYDEMNQMILSQLSDATKDSKDPDYFKQTRNQFNGFGEVVKKANPYVAQNMVLNPSKVDEIWKNESHRLKYVMGLNVESKDSLNRTTVYYYDQEKRPYISISPTGLITYITYDAFSNKENIRRYDKAVPTAVLPTLTGGFNIKEIQDYINQKDDQKDLIDIFEYDKRGIVKTHIDPKKNVYTFIPNAFKQISTEIIPIADSKTMEITHGFDTRGNETSTTRKAGDLEITTKKEFNTPFNAVTAEIDGNNGKTSYMRDLLGRVSDIINALQQKSSIKYNAFRAFQYIDELNRVKELIYDQTTKIETTSLYQLPQQPSNQLDSKKETKLENKSEPVKAVVSIEQKNIFDQVISSKDGLGNETKTTHEPDGQVKTITNALNETITTVHDLEGQIESTTDASNLKTSLTRDNAGVVTLQIEQKVDTRTKELKSEQHIPGDLVVVEIKDGEVKQTVVETKINENPAYKTITEPDTFGRIKKKTDPNGVVTENTLDKCDNQTESKIHIATDNATVSAGTAYNAINQPTVLSMEQKDEKEVKELKEVKGAKETKLQDLKQTNKRTDRDSLSREIGQTLDPDGLKISTRQSLNKNGVFVSKTDEENNTTFYIRDAKDQIRFVVDPRRGVQEKIYDASGQIIQTINYTNALKPGFNINDQSTPEEIKANVEAVDSDTLSLYFYGLKKNQERFRLDIIQENGKQKAIVHETKYNAAFEPIITTDYFAKIDADSLSSFTTAYLEKNVKTTSGKDRTEYKILDAIDQERFIIDPKGYVVELVYNSDKQITEKIIYDTPLTPTQIQEITQLPESQVRAKLPINKDKDIAECNIYDDLKHLIFTVNGKGAVIGFKPNYNNDVESECHYDKPIVDFTDYEDLCKKLIANYKPDATIDRLTATKYDEARRKRQITTPAAKQRTLTPDVLGNTAQEKDEVEKIWISVFDKASRLTETSTPLITKPELKGPIVTAKEYYKTGKIKTITEAKGLPKARTIAYEYDESGHLILAKVLNQAQKFEGKLENVPGTIVYQASYSAKNNKLSEQNKAGEWTYYIHDEQNRLIFTVNSVGAVTEHVRDTFGDEIETRQYNKSIKIDGSYATKGIPLTDITAIIKDAKYNQSKQDYDTRGDLRRKEVLNGDKIIAAEETLYNASRKPICTKKLIKDNEYASKFTFYDKTSETIAEIDEEKFVNGLARNVHGEIEKETQYVKKLTDTPDANWSEAQLAESLKKIASEKDRVKETRYNLCGQVQNEIEKELVIQEAVKIEAKEKKSNSEAKELKSSIASNVESKQISVGIDVKSNVSQNSPEGLTDSKSGQQQVLVMPDASASFSRSPSMLLAGGSGIQRLSQPSTQAMIFQNKPKQDATTSYAYNAVQDKSKTTLPNKAELFHYHDERHALIGETGIPRKVVDKDGKETIVTPFTGYKVNELNQTEEKCEFKSGLTTPPTENFPELKKSKDDFVTRTERDNLDHVTKEIKDNNNLQLTTERKPNQKDLPLYEIDANKNKWRLYYDAENRERFKIGPEGEIYEQVWDCFDNVSTIRVYDQKIDPSEIKDSTTLEDIQNLAVQSKVDSVTYQVFDQNKNLRYAIKLNGLKFPTLEAKERKLSDSTNQVSIIGYQYNGLKKTTAVTEFSTKINLDDVLNKDANQLDDFMAKKVDPDNDRTTFYIRNNRGEPCIIIAPNGAVTEQEFDADGHMIRQTRYDGRVPDPKEFSKNSLNQAKTLLKPNAEHDRTIYHVYNDKLNKLEYEIDEMGKVTRYAYNISKQCLGKTIYAQKVEAKDYNDLITKLSTLESNLEKDQTFVNTLNDAGQILEEIAPNPIYKDSYQFDIFGNRVTHTNKKGSQFVYGFDTANRQTTLTSPGILATKVNFDGSHLTCEQLENQKAIEEKVLDKLGFIKQTIKAKGSYEERTINSSFNHNGQFTGTEIKGVNVDNGGNASFTNRPEKKTDIKTQKVYNAKKQMVAECDENNIWKFYVYDNCNNEPIYEINNAGAVVQYQRNAFGQAELVTHFETKLAIDLNSYKITGIPRNIVEDNLKANPLKDRWVKLTYTRLGKVASEEYNPVYCLNQEDAKKLAKRLPSESKEEKESKENKIDSIRLEKVSPKTTYDYNTFGDQISAKKQMDAKTIAETNCFFNRNGKKIAELSPEMFLTRIFYDVFGNEEKVYITHNPLDNRIKLDATQSEIDAIADKKKSDEDQSTENVHDRSNFVIKKTFINVPVVLTNLEPGKPLTYEEKLLTLTLTYTYTPTGKIESITDEKNRVQFFYYNACDDLIAFTDVPRLLDYDTKLVGIPLTQNGVNLHGQVIAVKNNKNNAISPFYNILQGVTPNGKLKNNSDDPNDQLTLTKVDERGKVSLKQDPEGNLTGSTQTPAGQIARTWWLQTGHDIQKATESKGELKPLSQDKEGNAVVRAVHTEEERVIFDAATGKPIGKIVLRDNQELQRTEALLNTFLEIEQEGPGGGIFPFQTIRDNAGRIWKTNEGGVWRLHLYNLAGDEICKIQSAIKDLSIAQYDDQPALIVWPESEITVTQRNLESHVKSVTPPALFQADVTKDLPLQMCVSNTFPQISQGLSLSWTPSQIENIKGFFSIRKRGSLDPFVEMDVKFTSARAGVDLTKLVSTDIYEYVINYYLCDPITKELIDKDKKNVLYCSKGYFACDLNNSQTSLNVVVSSIDQQGFVTLSGKTTDITDVEVYSNNQFVQKLPFDSKQMTVDCSKLPAATYQFKPCLKDGSLAPATLAFALHTSIKNPSRTPLSEEFDYKVEVDTDKESKQGEIKLTLNRFAKQPLLFSCKYTTPEGKNLTLPNTKILFDEEKGYVVNFEDNVDKINEISLSVFIDNDHLLKLYDQEQPLVPTSPKERKDQAVKFIHTQLKKPITTKTDEEYDFCEDETEQDFNDDGFVHADLKDSKVVTSQPCASLFQEHHMIELSPFTSLPEFKEASIRFLDVSQDSNAAWKMLNCSGYTERSLYLDVSGLDLGNYPYEIIGDLDNTGRVFSITNGCFIFSSDPYSHNKHVLVQHQFVTNRYGDVITYIDSLGNKTDIKYNNRLRKPIQIIKPETTVMLDDSKTVVRVRPTTSIGYDEKGHANVKKHPRGNVVGSVINEAGESLVNVMGDGTITKKAHLNNLHQEENYRDARNELWQRKHNRNNIVTETTMPNGITNASEINEKNQCIQFIAARGTPYAATTLMGYDFFENMTLEWKVEQGIWKEMTYHRSGKMASQRISSSKILLWDINYFGQIQSRTNYDGEVFKFGYDFNQNITTQKSLGLKTPRQFFDYRYARTQVTINFFGLERTVWVDKVIAFLRDVLPQNLEFSYNKGRLSKIIDWAHQRKMLYTTDSEERKISWEIRNYRDVLVTQSNSAYNEIGLETLTYDPILTVRTLPDLNGNRKISDVTVVNPLSGKTNSIRLGSIYDPADRPVLFNGLFDGNTIKLANHIGLGLAYKNDFRTTETKIENNALITTTLEPNTLGLLYRTTQSDGKFNTERVYNPHFKLQRFVTSREGTPTTEEMEYLGNGSGTLSLRTVKKAEDFQCQTKYSEFNEAGQAERSTVFWKAPEDYSLYDDNKFAFRWADSAVLTHINTGRCVVDRGHSIWSYGDSYLRQDANNNLNSVEGYEDKPDRLAMPGTCIFDTVPFGQILKRMTLTMGSPFAEVTFICHNPSGQAAGSYGYGQNPEMDAPKQNTQSFLRPVLFGNGLLTSFRNGTSYDGISGRQLVSSSGYGLRINNGIEEAAKSYPDMPAVVETKEDGESAEDVAADYGNSSKADLIAAANDTSPTQTFKKGHSFIAPPLMSENNRVGEFGNYAEFKQKLMVNLMPKVQEHLNNSNDGGFMSFITEVAKIVVIGLATIYAPGIAPYAMAYCFGGAFAASAIGQVIALNITRAVTAALIDAAGQAALVGLHMQPKISGEEILNVGLGQLLTPGANADIANRIVGAAVTNSVAQLIRMSITSNHKFDFRSVVTSMAAAGIGEGIGSRLSKTTADIVVGTVLETATTSIATGLIYQRSPLIQDVLAQSIGAATVRGVAEMNTAADRQAEEYQPKARVEEADIHRGEQSRPVPPATRPQLQATPKPQLSANDQQFVDSIRIPSIPKAKVDLASQAGQNGFARGRSEGLRSELTRTSQAQSVNQASMEQKHSENALSSERWKNASVAAQEPKPKAMLANSRVSNIKQSFFNALKDQYNGVKWAYAHPQEFKKGLLNYIEGSVEELSDPHVFESRLKNGDNLVQSIRDKNDAGIGEGLENLATNLFPAGKVLGVIKAAAVSAKVFTAAKVGVSKLGAFGGIVKEEFSFQKVELFENQFPEHQLERPKIIPNSQLKNINGKFNYIVTHDGQLIVGRAFDSPGGGHIDLASGKPVRAAGEVKIVDNQVKYIDNASGHYMTEGLSAQLAAEKAFNHLGFETVGKYLNKIWVTDPNLQRGGAWRVQQ